MLQWLLYRLAVSSKLLFTTLLLASLLGGCSSSDDDDDDDNIIAQVAGPSGTGMLGIIRNAVVTVTGIDGVNTVLGTGTTDTNGQYGPIMIPETYTGPLRITLSPAADGSSTFICDFQAGCPLPSGGQVSFGEEVPFDLSLEAVAPTQNTSIVNITPFTHSATMRVDQLGTLSAANVNQANQEMANLLGRLLASTNALGDDLVPVIVPRDFFALPVIDLVNILNVSGDSDQALGLQITLLNASLIGLIDNTRNLSSIADVVNSLAASFADDGSIEDNEAVSEIDAGAARQDVIRLVDILAAAASQVTGLINNAGAIVAAINIQLQGGAISLDIIANQFSNNTEIISRGTGNNPNVLGFSITLTGDFVVPPVTTNSQLSAQLSVNTRSGRAFASIGDSDLVIESAALRFSEAGLNGETILDLAASRSNANRFVLPPASFLSDSDIAALLQGRIYLQVVASTPADSSSDGSTDDLITLRGQVLPANIQVIREILAGEQEVPPVVTDSSAIGYATINTDTQSILSNVRTIGFIASVVHIHQGDAGLEGAVVIDMEQDANQPELWLSPESANPVSDEFFAALLSAGTYFNAHSEANPGGEVRAQLTPANFMVIRNVLDGEQEVPPVVTASSAIGNLTINLDTQEARGNVRTVDFIATMVHVHQGDAGVEGAIVIDFEQDQVEPELWFLPEASSPVNDEVFAAFLNGGTYFNAHSEANPGGEVRAQITAENILVIRNILDGEQEVPPVVTASSGIGNLTINTATNEVRGNVRTVDFIATMVHVHQGDAGVEGAIIVDFEQDLNEPELWLFPDADSPVSDERLTAILNGGTYFNAHSEANPGGEVRAQITADNIVVIREVLDGEQEVPPVITASSAIGNLTINTDTREIRGNLRTIDFISTMVHIHEGDAGVEGAIIIDFEQDQVEPELWFLPAAASPVSAERLDTILSGGTYFNAHSAANPGGEVRAQITPANVIVVRNVLDGEQEVPPVMTSSSGIGNLTINLDTREIRGNLRTIDFIATMVHIHQGDAGVEGAIIIDFDQDQAEPELWFLPTAASPLSQERLEAILAGGTYFNAHSAANPGGEVRAQITPPGIVIIREVLDGEQEVPPVMTMSSGIGNLTVNINTGDVRGNVRTIDFIATMVHIHQGDAGLEGAIVIDLDQDMMEPELWLVPAASSPVSDELLEAIVNGGTYFNAHSAANPGGEVRAQITPANVIVIREVLDGVQEVPPVMTMNSGIGNVTINGFTREIRGNVRTIGFIATAVHIHEGPAGEEGAIIIDFEQEAMEPELWTLPASASPVSMERLMTILNEGTYFNAHSAANPGGEVRGQLIADETVSMQPLTEGSIPLSAGSGSAASNDSGSSSGHHAGHHGMHGS